MRGFLRLVVGGMLPVSLLAAAACSSGTASPDTVSTPLLVKLQHNGASPRGWLYVWTDGRWEFESPEACKVASGTLTQAELTQLQMNLDAVDVDRLAAPDGGCPETTFEMYSHNRRACWASDSMASGQADHATQALAKFLEDRTAALDWDGAVSDCTKVPPGLPTKP